MDIRTYEHENYGKLRLFCKDGFYWFIGKDAATMLGYKNPSVTRIRVTLSQSTSTMRTSV